MLLAKEDFGIGIGSLVSYPLCLLGDLNKYRDFVGRGCPAKSGIRMSVNADGTFRMDSTPGNTVGVGVSQSVSQITTTSVVTEEMTRAEPYQFPSTESAPENDEKFD